MDPKEPCVFFYPQEYKRVLFFLTLELTSVNKRIRKKDSKRSKIYLVNSENIPTFVVYKY